MGPLTALVLATPIFGFVLHAPQITALPASGAPTMQVESALSADAVALSAESVALSASGSADSAPKLDQATYVQQLRKRAKLAKVHRTLGITTWALTGLATIAGTVQYRNLYGAPFTTKLEDTPCVKGTAWGRQESCYGTPWLHAITGIGAGAFYFTTLGLAMAMPDPDHASEGKSQYAKTVRTHKILRWVHLTGMVSQMVLGIVIANPGLTGLDRANDYSTLKALAGFHLASGYITLGALSWAGTIMLL